MGGVRVLVNETIFAWDEISTKMESFDVEILRMKRIRFRATSVVASALVVCNLGVSGFIGAVTAMAGDQAVLKRTAVTKVKANTKSLAQIMGARLTKDGRLTGRLNLVDAISGTQTPVEKLSVKLVQRGSIVSEVKVGPGGVFQAEGLQAGNYSLVADGAEGFFTVGLAVYPHVESEDAAKADKYVAPVQIDATVVHPSNIAAARKLVSLQAKRSQRRPASVQKAYATAPVRTVETAEIDPIPVQTPIFSIDENGAVAAYIVDTDPVTGELSPAEGATLYFLQKGKLVGQYRVDANGSFSAPDLKAGAYSIVAISERNNPSYAAAGVVIEVGSEPSNVVQENSRLQVQNVKLAAAKMASSHTLQIPSDPAAGSNEQPEVAADGGAAGDGGGSFGGGGGGAGLAALAGLAGLAGIGGGGNNPASPKK